jgi:Arc/MetJ family transcription regulator
MRTNIEIDDTLIKQAMKATGSSTKKGAVDAALRLAVRLKKQGEIRRLFGKVQWEGDLAATREGRFLDWEEQHEKIQPPKQNNGQRVRAKTAAR